MNVIVIICGYAPIELSVVKRWGVKAVFYTVLHFKIFHFSCRSRNQNAVFGGSAVQNHYLHYPLTCLERLLARRPEGIFINPFERGEIGPDLFAAACRMGLEGLVSKTSRPPVPSRPIKTLGQLFPSSPPRTREG
jgi:hypothetical protein